MPRSDKFVITKIKSNPKIDGLLFSKAKEAIMGKKYVLSLAFVDRAEIRKWNKMYRGKDKPTDVLSFSLSKSEGQILICEAIAKAKAEDFGKTREQYLNFIFVHAMLHLKGMLHGSRMEEQEAKWLKKFQLE